MILLQIALDQRGQALINRFMSAHSHWEVFMEGLAYTMGSDAREHIKPFTKAKAVWNGSTHGTGALEDSIKEDVNMNGNGFAVTFDGLFYGNYMDVGNFPAGTKIARSNGNDFPVGLRAGGAVTMSKYIHGMGHRTKDVPTHFSEKTAEWLGNQSNMNRYCDELMGRFLRELVS